MTWTLGQHNQNSSSSSSSSIASGTFTTGATSTTLVVGFVAYDDRGFGDDLTSVTANLGGNTYNLGNHGESSAGNGTFIKGFWLYGPSSAPTIFTANFTNAHLIKAIYTAFFTSSIAGTITLDANPVVATGNSASPTTTSVTPAVSGELYVAGMGNDGGGTVSAGGSATLLNSDIQILGGDEYQVNSGSSALALSFSITTSSTWAAAVLTFKEPAAGGVAWGFDEETLRRSQGWRARAAWRARPAQDEFIRNPTQFPAPPWVQDPDYFPRRLRSWRAHPEPIREEFLNNPTQFPAPPWVHDPDYFPRRRQSWRAHPEPLREEFLNNPTQAVFSPWIFDDQQRLPRAAAQNRKTQQNDDLSPPVVAAVTVPFTDDPVSRLPRRASKPAISQSDIEGLPFTAATPLNWADLEQSAAPRRSMLIRRAQQDDQIGLPQLVGVSWGFDEEQHRLQRAIFHRLVWQDDPIGLPQLVGVGWGFDEEQHRLQRRVFHRLVWQDDPLGLPQLVGVPWGFEEEPQHQFRQRRSWRAQTLPLADEFLFNPTQIAFSPWGFEEQKWRRQISRWLAHPQPADNEGWPFSVTPQVPWGGIEQGIQRRPLPARRPVLSWVDEDGWIQSGIFPLTAHWGGNVWWITANGGTGARAWVSIGLGPNPSYQTRLRSMYLVLSGSSATSAMMVVRDGPTQVGTVIFQADLYTASNGWDFLDFNGIDLRATVGNVLTVEFVAGTPSNVQQINAGGDYVLPGTSWGV